MPMPMDIRPERGNSIQIPIAFGVEEIDSLTTLDHELRRIHPVAHLREGVPEVRFVESFVVDAVAFHRLAKEQFRSWVFFLLVALRIKGEAQSR